MGTREHETLTGWHFALWLSSEMAHEQTMTAVAQCRSVGDTRADGAEREFPLAAKAV
jgi:hypothetical protein